MATKRISHYLPEELIFIILQYLPLYSLLRFSLASKSWRSIILNHEFTESHKKQAFLVLNEDDVDHVYVDTREKSVKLQVPSQCNGMVRYIYSCNGLVCLADLSGDVICLWNPLTKRLKMLPTSKVRGPCERISLGCAFYFTSNDYKILRIRVSISHSNYAVDKKKIVLEADMYSLNAGYWKEIKIPKTVQSLNIMVSANSKCVHDHKTGVLYFEGYQDLISFDLHKEVFEVYPFPTSVQPHKSKSNVLDFEGSVAMIFKSGGDESVLSLWTLDDVCDNKVSWTKKFNLEANLKIDWVSLYLGFGQFVAKNDVVGHIFYDYKKKNTQKFLSPAPPALSAPTPAGYFSSVVKYTESLVSVEGLNNKYKLVRKSSIWKKTTQQRTSVDHQQLFNFW